MKHFLSACTLLLAVTTSSAQTFFLDDNGITIKCIDCAPGDIGIVNGVEYTAVDNAALQAAVDDGLTPLSHLCTSLVTNTSELFEFDSDFNEDITNWDMSGVTSTYGMFLGASSFNQPIGHWDVSSVTDMSFMFVGCDVFNQPLDAWDVSSVTDMGNMFEFCDVFNQPLGAWDVSSVTDMGSMFRFCDMFNQPLEAWDVSSVTDMESMFQSCDSLNQPLGAWDVSSVTDMSSMFFSCYVFNQPLDAWDVSSVTDMSFMFNSCDVFNQPLGAWDVSLVTDMSHMFVGCDVFNQPLDAWDVSSVTDMGNMFEFCDVFNQPLGAWDVSSVTDMGSMFRFCDMFNQPLEAWDVSSVTDMERMFRSCDSLNQPLGAWDVSSVTDMSSMFASCDVFNQPLDAWDVSSVTDMSFMFYSCDVFNQPLSGWDVSGVNNMERMFFQALSFDQDVSNWCVLEIPFEPFGFNSGGQLAQSQLPVWGECPGCVVPEGNCNCQSVDADNDGICDNEDCSFELDLCLDGPPCTYPPGAFPEEIPSPQSGFCFGGVINVDSITNHSCWQGTLQVTDSSDVSQFRGIYVNMEHSFLGDLQMTVSCPQGQSLTFQSCGGVGADLGFPLVTFDETDTIPGIGLDYFWSESSLNGPIMEVSGSQVPSATYSGEGNWSDLNECSTNGQWTLEICDLWAGDNGYVFDWGIVIENPTGEVSLQRASCATSLGCLDELACNYDSEADYDNGQCEYLDECGICGGEGAIYECGCLPEGDCDCNGNQLDAAGVCGGDCSADSDGDGICDDVDDCLGAYDACGVCNGPGPIFECGCFEVPEGYCSCEVNDLDDDGICDNEDCSFELDLCLDGPPCTYPPGAFSEAIPSPLFGFSCDGGVIDVDSTINHSCWQGTLQVTDSSDVSQVRGIYVNMEHSFLGDLQMTVSCPQGQSLTFQSCGGGGADLGFPLVTFDETDTIPGIGLDYFWSESSLNGPIMEVSGSQVPSATYSVEGNWSDLNECSTNGQWTLEICDLWSGDNGYVFDWGIVIENPNGDVSLQTANCSLPSGCLDQFACNYDPDAEYDNGQCEYLDECGVCAGEGIAEGACDCNGNQLDALGVCGGDCAADADDDGICDDVDDCVGEFDAVNVCGGDCTVDADGDGICDDVDTCIDVDADGTCDLVDCSFELDLCLDGPPCTYPPGAFPEEIPSPQSGSCFGGVINVDSTINHSCWQGELQVTESFNVSQFRGIYVNMEHSFLGDLQMTVSCPQGQSLTFKSCGENGGNLGFPLQPSTNGADTIPGIGLDYFWSESSLNGPIMEVSGSQVPSATYSVEGNWSDLNECSTNGQWTLEICDLWSGDNGYVFDWGIVIENPNGDVSLQTANCSLPLGCLDEFACNYDPQAEYDNGQCEYLDECGVCGGEGIAEGACDCNGNQLDALGVCGGDCAADADDDGICDDVDDCVGEFDAVNVCGGDCTVDADGDGICDDVDTCIDVDADGTCDIVDCSYELDLCLDGPPCTYPLGAFSSEIPSPTGFFGLCISGDVHILDSTINLSCWQDSLMVPDSFIVDQFQGFYINMEHSRLNDLRMTMTCPEGQSLTFVSCGEGGNTNLGIPFADSIPGIGLDYFWSESSSNGLITELSGFQAPSTTYSVEGNWSDLNECSTNGQWTLEICDFQNGDNGFVFDWGIVVENPNGDVSLQTANCSLPLGCLDQSACNYDPDAEYDNDQCEYLDECGICGGEGIDEGACDCDGNQLDALGVCGGDCSADLDLDGICDDVDDCVGEFDAINVCGGDCTEDADADGICDDVDDCIDTDMDEICDDVDDCVGAYDPCGVCNGPGPVFECGCFEVPEGNCDCESIDLDGDGICDSVDDCFSLAENPGSCCEMAAAQIDCFFNGIGSCSDTLFVAGWQGVDSLEIYLNHMPVISGDDSFPIDLALQIASPAGDTILMGGFWAGIAISDVGGEYLNGYWSNWSANPNTAAIYTEVVDLSDYDLVGEGDWVVTVWNTYPAATTWQVDVVLHGVCGQEGVSCVNDADGDGICDFEDDCVGEYDACGVCGGDGIAEGACDCEGNVLDECGVCGGDGIAEGACDCDGNQLDALGVCGGDCVSDVNGNGICDLEELSESGEAMCGQGTVWNEELGVCVVALPTDANFDGCVGINDLLELLAFYGQGECFMD